MVLLALLAWNVKVNHNFTIASYFIRILQGGDIGIFLGKTQITHYMKAICFSSLYLGILITGKTLYGKPLSIFEVFSAPAAIGAFLIFLSFALSSYSWGIFLALRFSCERFLPWVALPLGMAFYVFVVGFSGLFGWLPMVNFFVVGCISWLGIFLMIAAVQGGEVPWNSVVFPFAGISGRTKTFRIIALFVFIFSLLPLLLACKAYEFWDPLWYHLVGPRIWYEAGKIFFPTNHLIAFNTGAWDYLYLYSFFLLGERGGGGLLPAQIFSQWLHAGLGFAASVPIFFVFLRMMGFPRILAILAAFSAFSIPVGFFTSFLAKNDWGVLLWFFSGITILLGNARKKSPETISNLKDKKRLLLAGIFLGLAFTSKWTVLFLLIPLSLFAIWESKNSNKRGSFHFVGLGFFIGVLPIVLRNIYFVANPIYPLFSDLFSRQTEQMIGPTWKQNLISLAGGATNSPPLPPLEHFSMIITELLGQNFFYQCFWLLPLAFYLSWKKLDLSDRRRSLMKKNIILWCIVVASFFVFYWQSGYYSLLRWILVTVVCMGALGVFSFYHIIELLMATIHNFFGARKGSKREFAQKRILQQAITIFCFALILFWESPLSFAIRSVQTVFSKSFSQEFQESTVGRASLWLRKKLQDGEKIASLAETRVYYISDLPFTRVWDSVELDRKISKSIKAKDFFQILGSEKFRYLLDTYESIDRYQREDIIRNVRLAYASRKDCFSYRDKKAVIVDIECLNRGD